MTQPLRAAIAGCGGMSNHWLGILKNHREAVEIVGLADIAPGLAAKRADEHGLAGAVTGEDIRVVLDACLPDVVFDLTIPEAHREVVLAALERGCHVLGEKPLADTIDNARAMIAAARAAGRLYAVMQNRRYMEPIRRLREHIASGAMGKLTTLNSDFYLAPRFGGFRDQMQHVLLLDMAIHTFDAARYLSGAKARSVQCLEWNPSNSWYKHGASAVAIFELDNGAVYTYRGSWCADGLNTSWECDWRVVLERGSVRWDGAAGFAAERLVKCEGFAAECEKVDLAPVDPRGKEGGHEGCILEFLRCVRDGSTPETTAEDNFHSLAMVLAAIDAAGQRRAVDVQGLD